MKVLVRNRKEYRYTEEGHVKTQVKTEVGTSHQKLEESSALLIP